MNTLNLQVKTSTWVRTLVFAIAIINQILVAFGKSPLNLDEAMINNVIIQLDMLIASVMTIVTGVIGFWKNNSFSKAAVEADEVLAQKKKEVNK